MKGFSIQSKILTLLLSLIIIPTLLMTILSFSISTNALVSEVTHSMEGVTTNLEDTLNFFLGSYEDAISTLATNQDFKNIRSKSPEGREASAKLLDAFVKNYDDFNLVYFSTLDNEMFIYPYVELGNDFKAEERPWYQAALAKKEGPAWTEPHIDYATGEVIITIAQAVYDSNDALAGVVGADIILKKLTDTVGSFRIGENGYFILTDAKGNIMTHPELEKIGQPLDITELMDVVVSGTPSGSVDYKYHEEHMLSSYTTIEKTGWKIFGNVNYSEVSRKTSAIHKSASFVLTGVIAVAVILGILLSKPITKGIKHLSQDMTKIGQGDFTIRSTVKSKDEIGLLSTTLNKMSEELGDIFSKIKGLAGEVANSSTMLAATSEESSATTEEVARTINEIVKVTEEQAYHTEEGLKITTQLAERIQNISQEIEKITQMIKDSSALSIKGMDSVTVLKEKANANNLAAARIGDVILEVDKSAAQVSIIVDTISNIASQTNLLALNASIEAARASEAGRGFAVVAEEIRKLAEQSAEASNNIGNLIKDIQEQSKHAVISMDEAKPIVIEQDRAVAETKDVFNEIYAVIEHLDEEVAHISELNTGLLQKKDEIVATMESLSASAQQTSASTQQISASTHEQLAATDEVAKTAEQMNRLAQNLSAEIEKFKV